MTVPNVAVRVTGEDAGVGALLKTLSRQLGEFEKLNSAFARSTTATGKAAKQTAQELSAFEKTTKLGVTSVGSLAGGLVSLAAAYALVRGAVSAVARGIDVNSQLESTSLGIASVITAQATLTDANGKVLKGTEALNAAQGISADQLQKLRIDALSTTATFAQLSKAFETAVGPGLTAGLNLDGVRQFTTQIAQAAAAINLPMNQLDQEVRSILDGTIDRNSRVAKTLQITNEQVKLERERGTLQTFLNSKFAAFNVAGQAQQKTMAGVLSNVKQVGEVLGGLATKPLFEKVRDSLFQALQGVLDLKTAKLAPAFDGIVKLAQTAFAGLGDLLASAITGAVQGAKDLSAFISENRDAIVDFAKQVFAAVKALASAVIEAVKLAASLAGAATDTGILSGALKTVENLARLAAGAMKFLREHTEGLVAVLAGGLFLKFGPALALTAAEAATAGVSFTSLLGLINPVTAAIIGLTTVYAILEGVQASARVETEKQNTQLGRILTLAPALADEYRKTAKALSDGTLKGFDAVTALDRLNDIRKQLIAISPDFAKALSSETGGIVAQAKAADELIAKNRELAAQQLIAADAAVASLERALNATAAGASGSTNLFGAASGRVSSLRTELNEAKAAAEALRKAVQPLPDTATEKKPDPKLKKNPPPVDAQGDGAKALSAARIAEAKALAARERAQAESDVKASEVQNDAAYRRGLISLQQFYDAKASIILRVNREEIDALQKERAQIAAEPLLVRGKKEGPEAELAAKIARATKLADIDAKIVLRGDQTARDLQTNDRDREQSSIALADTISAAEAKIQEAQGNTLASALRNVQTQADAYSKALLEAGVRGSDLQFRVKLFVDTQTAKVQFDDAQKRAQQALDALARDRDAISTQVDLGAVSQLTGQQRLLDLERQRAPVLQKIGVDLTKAAAALGPDEQDKAAQYANEIAKIGRYATVAQQQLSQLSAGIKQSLQSALGDTLARLGSDITTFGGAIQNLATNAVQAIQRIVAELLSQDIIDFLSKLGGGGGSGGDKTANATGDSALKLAAAGGVVDGAAAATSAAASALSASGGVLYGAAAAIQTAAFALAAAQQASNIGNILDSGVKLASKSFAVGGHVTGPGTATSDSIPARLSAGEYVLRASAVQHFGISQLDAMNAIQPLNIRRHESSQSVIRHFSEGGFVFPAAQTADSVDGSNGAVGVPGAPSTIHIGLEEGLILRAMQTRAGQKVTIETLRTNPRLVKALTER